jgi:hypothetical protein
LLAQGGAKTKPYNSSESDYLIRLKVKQPTLVSTRQITLQLRQGFSLKHGFAIRPGSFIFGGAKKNRHTPLFFFSFFKGGGDQNREAQDFFSFLSIEKKSRNPES